MTGNLLTVLTEDDVRRVVREEIAAADERKEAESFALTKAVCERAVAAAIRAGCQPDNGRPDAAEAVA